MRIFKIDPVPPPKIGSGVPECCLKISYIAYGYTKLEVPAGTLKLSNLGHGKNLDGWPFKCWSGSCSYKYCKIPGAEKRSIQDKRYQILGQKKKKTTWTCLGECPQLSPDPRLASHGDPDQPLSPIPGRINKRPYILCTLYNRLKWFWGLWKLGTDAFWSRVTQIS